MYSQSIQPVSAVPGRDLFVITIILVLSKFVDYFLKFLKKITNVHLE